MSAGAVSQVFFLSKAFVTHLSMLELMLITVIGNENV